MRRLPLLVAALALVHCGVATEANEEAESKVMTAEPAARDWTAHPAVVDVAAPADLYVVSDIHGEVDLFRALLRGNGLVDSHDAWTGGTSLVVIAGDLIDKGPESLEVIDLVRSLGSHVVTTLGNHEAEFLTDPFNSKATSTGQDKEGIDNELQAQSIDPRSVASGTDAAGRGAWLASLPFAARVGGWFFAHAGNASTLSFSALGPSLAASVDARGYSALTSPDSLLEATGWYGLPTDSQAGQAQASALGVSHIVFGHDPKAFGDRGHICASANDVLVKIDTAMGIQTSSSIGPALMLHVHHDATGDSVDVRDTSGSSNHLKHCH